MCSLQTDGGLEEIEQENQIPLATHCRKEKALSAPVANQCITLIQKTIFYLTKVRFPNVASQILCYAARLKNKRRDLRRYFLFVIAGRWQKVCRAPRSDELSEVMAVERIYY